MFIDRPIDSYKKKRSTRNYIVAKKEINIKNNKRSIIVTEMDRKKREREGIQRIKEKSVMKSK